MVNGGGQNFNSYLNDLIEGMRPRLLDLTRRNPLLATPFSERSHSNVRVVDEIPSFLFEKLLTERMRLFPLPSLEEDPKDELSNRFINAISQARYTDEEYITKLNEIDQEQENSDQELLILERELKDRIRVELGMPERQTKMNLSLQQHARNHNINPSYDLSFNLQENELRHIDNDIQTLLLPDQFERRLNGILGKVRTWQQETGISVFHIAFGFLEWFDSNSNKASFAPLILMPASLEKERKSTGVEFYITSEGESPVENVVLSEKLKLDYAIDLPKFEQNPVLEKYIKNIEASIPKHLQWRVRNQVALGVFPSAKMAMYHDLDTNNWDFNNNEIIKSLFIGNENTNTATPFADDYEVDEPKFESKVPYLITQADSSQFSTLVDLEENNNLAVEGPPGSGKSQTIINAIAAALHEGKKILFVAEKTAALEVVKSRLEALSLGEFILPLLATRKTSRASIIESLRERVELGGYHIEDIKKKKTQYSKYKNRIKEYVDVLARQYRDTGLTVHEILGQRLKYDKYVQSLPKNLKNYSMPNLGSFTEELIQGLKKVCKELEAADLEYSQGKDYWNFSNVINLTPYATDNILNHISECAESFSQNKLFRDKLLEYGFDRSIKNEQIEQLLNIINNYISEFDSDIVKIIKALYEDNSVEQLNNFIISVKGYRKLCADLEKKVKDVENIENIQNISRLITLCEKYSLNIISKREFDKQKQIYENEISELRYIYELISKANEKVPDLKDKTPFKIVEFCYVASLSSRESLAFRSEVFEDPLFADYIKKQQKLAATLKAKKIELSGIFYVDRELDKDEINKNLNTMRSAGLFRIFSGNYRLAKRYYKSISKKDKFVLETAINSLLNLLEFEKKQYEFNNDINLKNLFKYKYEGLNTDFKIVNETLHYYKNVEENFSSSDDAFLRDYLLHQSSDNIRNLPKPDLDKCQNLSNYGNQELLITRLNHLEGLSKNVDIEVNHMKSSFETLNVDETNMDELRETLKLLKRHQLFKNEINNIYIKGLLGEKLFNIHNTDIDYLSRIIKYYNDLLDLNNDHIESLISVFIYKRQKQLLKYLTDIKNSNDKCQDILQQAAKYLVCEAKDIIKHCEHEGISKWAKIAKDDKEGLIRYSKLNSYKKAVSDYGFNYVIEILSECEERFQNIDLKIMGLLLNNLAESVYRDYGNQLAKYSGIKINNLREQLANIDREIESLASYYIAETLVQKANPPYGISKGPKRDWTEYSLINSEISKKQRYVSPRDLTRRAGKALLELKPCWMMSPLSVAQYIRKGDIEFDLLIIDEASQMTPENAVGAITRCKQAMIVGDTNQLPPTSFFKKFIAVDEDDEEDSVTEESILEIANNAFRPARRLRWHYRSEHSSLIAFSNKHIYGDDLTIYPSAYEDNPNMGVSLIKVDGLYSSGSNPTEAQTMIENIIEFMRENTERSLGVVTINQKQRDLLTEEFEYALSINPDLLDYINKWEEENDGLEAFFIKNLENVQGDERDVIFIGTVYGPQSPGARVMQRFGPINGVAGKRRLNVLFTRAKKQIITFSSMTSSDIVAEENTNQGAYLLKQWLEYSATNVLESGVDTKREPDSSFEEYVIGQIESMGCTAIPQVGVSGYFVDIGVRHPDWPHGYILGVECDGASYHSSKSARDRDRLREEILTKLGWRIYRIWSTDWFENPRIEAEKLRQIIQDRIKELKEEEGKLYGTVATIKTAEESGLVRGKEDKTIEVTEDLFDNLDEENRLLSESRARTLLIRLRDHEIAEEFEETTSEKGILNDNVIDILITEKPTSPSEFREYVPLLLREKIDHHQMIYLNTILDIIRKIK